MRLTHLVMRVAHGGLWFARIKKEYRYRKTIACGAATYSPCGPDVSPVTN
jgi:hypothetical protein